MSDYGVQSAPFHEAIHVGRLNKARTEFLDKVECTDMVLFAVAQYVLDNFEGGMSTTFPKAGLAVEIKTTQIDQEQP